MPNTEKTKDTFIKDVEFLDPRPENKLFIAKPADEWLTEAKNSPKPELLFDQLWAQQEIVFLFGGPGTGKSLYSVKIGREISKKERVLYFDFELSKMGFAKRYFDNAWLNRESFLKNFIRVELRPDIIWKEDDILDEIHNLAIQYDSKIIIIDNMTWIVNSAEKGADAATFMKKLILLKNKHNYSFLVVAHTFKRDENMPILLSHMSGSSQLSNLVDNNIAIVKSHKDKNIRYIKELKARHRPETYTYDNVKLIQLYVNESGVLCIDDLGTGHEKDHLRNFSEEQRVDKKNKAIEMVKQGIPYREIAAELGISPASITKYVKQDKEEGDLPF